MKQKNLGEKVSDQMISILFYFIGNHIMETKIKVLDSNLKKKGRLNWRKSGLIHCLYSLCLVVEDNAPFNGNIFLYSHEYIDMFIGLFIY